MRAPVQLLAPSFAAAFLSLLASLSAAAPQAPPGYYGTIDASSPAALRQTLHEVIDDHTRFPYTASSTDTWDILELAQQDPNDPGRVLDIYRNASYPKQGGGNSLYNREHSWPKSYGFPDDVPNNYPYTDCHSLFLAFDDYNTARSNKPYRYCSSGCTVEATEVNNGQGGGCCAYPGNSNWTTGSFTAGTWETWIGRRGDVARALFYLDVRYAGGTHSITGFSEPDLILTNSTALMDSKNTGNNESIGYMGILSDLLLWHLEDPVDDYERQRNDVVFSFQGNRNPFVDHPEWVECLFGSGPCTLDSLFANVSTISLTAGGTQNLTLSAGPTHPNHFFWIFGSVTGTSPGFPLDGGFTLPLNFDNYTLLTITNPTLPIFGNFIGFLTINGDGNASFLLPAGTDPGLAGLTFNHAYITAPLFGDLSFVSNPVPVTLVF